MRILFYFYFFTIKLSSTRLCASQEKMLISSSNNLETLETLFYNDVNYRIPLIFVDCSTESKLYEKYEIFCYLILHNLFSKKGNLNKIRLPFSAHYWSFHLIIHLILFPSLELRSALETVRLF